MKKLALLVSVLMLFSMVACANDNGNVDDDANITEDASDVTDDGGGEADEGAVTDEETTDTEGSGAANGGNGNGTTTGEGQTLTGKAQGYGGEVSVTVQVNGDDIVSVEVVGDKETQGVGTNAIDQLPDKIEEADSTDVEVVTGATVTSNAIKEAVDKALEGIK